LAGDLGLRHRTLSVSEEEVREEFDTWIGDLDYPSGNPTWIASSFIARAAHDDGVKVLLSGDGGDELFGGYSRWMKYLRFHDLVWRRTPQAARRVGGRLARPWARGLAGDIARRAAADGELFVPSRPWHDDLLARCLGPAGIEVAAACPPERTIEHLSHRFHQKHPQGDYLTWMSYVTLRTKLVEDYLHRLDKMGMRHSVEGRVPLLDPRIVRWALSTKQEVLVPRFRQKALLREAVAPILPPYVLERRKQGFCPPVTAWAEQLVSSRGSPAEGPLFESGLLRRDALSITRDRGARDSFAAWTLGTLVEWSSRNLGVASVAELGGVSS
jgi:asparagine synthase (glutamine-hydrolysing)